MLQRLVTVVSQSGRRRQPPPIARTTALPIQAHPSHAFFGRPKPVARCLRETNLWADIMSCANGAAISQESFQGIVALAASVSPPRPASRRPSMPPGAVRVPVWDSVACVKLTGNDAPMISELADWLKQHPRCEVWHGQRAKRRAASTTAADDAPLKKTARVLHQEEPAGALIGDTGTQSGTTSMVDTELVDDTRLTAELYSKRVTRAHAATRAATHAATTAATRAATLAGSHTPEEGTGEAAALSRSEAMRRALTAAGDAAPAYQRLVRLHWLLTHPRAEN